MTTPNKHKFKSLSDIQTTGKMIMIYGETGTGKTTSIIQSAPMPILYCQIEPRNITPSVEAAGRKSLKMDVYTYTNWMDFIAMLADPDSLKKYKTIVVDSFSYLSNVALSFEIENEIFESKKEKERNRKPLINSAKMSLEGFGGLASQMSRACRLLGKLSSEHGKVVICTALLSENPKYDRELSAAPALKGKEFPDNMPGFFDLIGLIKKRKKSGKVVFPPLVFFESPDMDFMCKYTGTGEKRNGPLNFTHILKTGKGGK